VDHLQSQEEKREKARGRRKKAQERQPWRIPYLLAAVWKEKKEEGKGSLLMHARVGRENGKKRVMISGKKREEGSLYIFAIKSAGRSIKGEKKKKKEKGETKTFSQGKGEKKKSEHLFLQLSRRRCCRRPKGAEGKKKKKKQRGDWSFVGKREKKRGRKILHFHVLTSPTHRKEALTIDKPGQVERWGGWVGGVCLGYFFGMWLGVMFGGVGMLWFGRTGRRRTPGGEGGGRKGAGTRGKERKPTTHFPVQARSILRYISLETPKVGGDERTRKGRKGKKRKEKPCSRKRGGGKVEERMPDGSTP